MKDPLYKAPHYYGSVVFSRDKSYKTTRNRKNQRGGNEPALCAPKGFPNGEWRASAERRRLGTR